MDFSVTQLLGLYFLIIGAIVVYRRKSIMPALNQLIANRPLLLVVAAVEILAGLAIVLVNPEVNATPNGLVALIGYMLIVEGIIYLAVPHKRVQKLVRPFSNAQWYSVGGVIAFLAGLYLTASGFGMI
jgi:uncharacterized membrane protein HdeD (DUF308 family)